MNTAERNRAIKKVSILVFLDPFATRHKEQSSLRRERVSILVFLDPFATIWHRCGTLTGCNSVSILVFLDPFATVNRITGASMVTLCFNPCFLRPFATQSPGRGVYPLQTGGFNPCFLRLFCNLGKKEITPRSDGMFQSLFS